MTSNLNGFDITPPAIILEKMTQDQQVRCITMYFEVLHGYQRFCCIRLWLGCGIASFILLVQVICYNSQFLIIYFKYYEYLYNMYDDEYLNIIEIEI